MIGFRSFSGWTLYAMKIRDEVLTAAYEMLAAALLSPALLLSPTCAAVRRPPALGDSA
jgi:hypothetical protein